MIQMNKQKNNIPKLTVLTQIKIYSKRLKIL